MQPDLLPPGFLGGGCTLAAASRSRPEAERNRELSKSAYVTENTKQVLGSPPWERQLLGVTSQKQPSLSDCCGSKVHEAHSCPGRLGQNTAGRASASLDG